MTTATNETKPLLDHCADEGVQRLDVRQGNHAEVRRRDRQIAKAIEAPTWLVQKTCSTSVTRTVTMMFPVAAERNRTRN